MSTSLGKLSFHFFHVCVYVRKLRLNIVCAWTRCAVNEALLKYARWFLEKSHDLTKKLRNIVLLHQRVDKYLNHLVYFCRDTDFQINKNKLLNKNYWRRAEAFQTEDHKPNNCTQQSAQAKEHTLNHQESDEQKYFNAIKFEFGHSGHKNAKSFNGTPNIS